MKRYIIAILSLMLTASMLSLAVGASPAMLMSSASVDFGGLILPSVIVGFIVALVFVLVEKSKMTTVKHSKEASQYVVRDSLRMKVQSDRFLYRSVTRRPRNTDKRK